MEVLEAGGERRGCTEGPVSGMRLFFRGHNLLGWCQHRMVETWIQPGLFLLDNSMERKRGKEGESIYKEVIIITADCCLRAG